MEDICLIYRCTTWLVSMRVPVEKVYSSLKIFPATSSNEPGHSPIVMFYHIENTENYAEI